MNYLREATANIQHRKSSKYWDSQNGCFRKRRCQYLHEDPKENIEIKCYACKFVYEKDVIKIHQIKGHEFKLCVQCDFIIINKEILTSRNFNMKKILRKELPNSSNEEIDRLVNE